jgi:hypothetical protein
VIIGDPGKVGKSESGIDMPLHTFDSFLFSCPTAFPDTCSIFIGDYRRLFDMSLTESAAVDAAHSASLASRRLATLNKDERNKALTLLHDALEMNREDILEANARDVELATIAAESGNLSQSVLKRLDLSRPGKYQDMLDGILSVRDLDDPSECSF